MSILTVFVFFRFKLGGTSNFNLRVTFIMFLKIKKHLEAKEILSEEELFKACVYKQNPDSIESQ